MAGHSKWANIRFRKGAQDAKRGKLFTKLIREITVATKTAEPNPENNPRLRAAMDKGLSNNMKRDTIETAIKKGSGLTDADNYSMYWKIWTTFKTFIQTPISPTNQSKPLKNKCEF